LTDACSKQKLHKEMDILTQPLAQFSLQIPGFGYWADRVSSGTRVTRSDFAQAESRTKGGIETNVSGGQLTNVLTNIIGDETVSWIKYMQAA